MFNQKFKLYFTFLFCILLLATFGFGCKQKAASPVTSNNMPAIIVQTPTSTPAQTPIPSETKAEDLKRLSRDFTALWGTYSSTSNCQNIRDLLPYMTKSFRSQNEDILDEDCGEVYLGPAFSWKTEVLDIVILNQSKQDALALVVCKRVKESGLIDYSNLIIELLVEKNASNLDEWKVDDAKWER